MPTLLDQLDKAIQDKRITIHVTYDMTNGIYKIYIRDNIENTEHLYTTFVLTRFENRID